jgi:tetratricopeptide (TPR) repeat protein
MVFDEELVAGHFFIKCGHQVKAFFFLRPNVRWSLLSSTLNHWQHAKSFTFRLTLRQFWRRYLHTKKQINQRQASIMKSLLALFIIGLFVFSQTGCGSKNQNAAANATSANANVPATEDVTTNSIHPEAQRLFDQGIEFDRQNKDAEAADAFKKAIEIAPDFAEAHLRLGMSYDVLQQKKEAEEEYKKAAESYQKSLRQDSKDAKAFYNMALAYNKLGKMDEAAKALRQAVKLDPENDDYQYEFGLALGHVAQYQEAVNALEKALEINPDNYRAQDALEHAKIDLQRWQSMVRQQEAIAKRQAAKDNKNDNANTSSNISMPPTPKPELE